MLYGKALAVLAVSAILASALPQDAPASNEENNDPKPFTVEGHYVSRTPFQDKLQFDIVSVLLLLGEATIWKSIWTRFRFRRCHWKQWIFAIAPGWAPLAGTVFAALQGSRGPPNLIYDRAPPEVLYANLELTNLNSGASHRAGNVILQNVWQAWYNGPRKSSRYAQHQGKYHTSKEVGIVDVDISAMEAPSMWALYIQSFCLIAQITLSLVLGLLGLSLEVFITFLVTLAAQGILLAAITPRKDAWDHRDLTAHKVAPVMLHMGMDTTSLLFVRSVTKDGKTFSLEEYSWESQTIRGPMDTVQLLLAGLSFCGFAFQLILVSWMSTQSKILFLILGFLGLITNAVEGAIEPSWDNTYHAAFTGLGFCEPEGSSLKSALGVLIAGDFSAGDAAAKLLYPDNKRFEQTLENLRKFVEAQHLTRLSRKIYEDEVNQLSDSKGIKDAVATVVHFLRHGTDEETLPRLVTTPAAKPKQYDWHGSKS